MISRQRLIASMSSKTNWEAGGHAIWTASVDTDGYPRVYVGVGLPLRNAVRIHYEIEHGQPAPGNMELRNTCGNRRCLSHVELVPRGTAGGSAAHERATDPRTGPFRCGHDRTPENTHRDGGCKRCRLDYQRYYNWTVRGRRPNRARLS